MVAYLPEYVDQINQQQLSFTEAMLTLTSTELEWNQEQSIERIVKRHTFRRKKTLKGFDFDFQPSINQEEVVGFSRFGVLEKNENLIFIGSQGR
ncbi:ATP-binding protein [Lacticaseibacillus rhamnosus]